MKGFFNSQGEWTAYPLEKFTLYAFLVCLVVIASCNLTPVYADCETGTDCEANPVVSTVCAFDYADESEGVLTIGVTDVLTIRSIGAMLESCIGEYLTWDSERNELTVIEYTEYTVIVDSFVFYHQLE